MKFCHVFYIQNRSNRFRIHVIWMKQQSNYTILNVKKKDVSENEILFNK